MHACAHTYIHTCIHTYINTSYYACMRTCIRTHIHTLIRPLQDHIRNTHTHTHMQKRIQECAYMDTRTYLCGQFHVSSCPFLLCDFGTLFIIFFSQFVHFSFDSRTSIFFGLYLFLQATGPACNAISSWNVFDDAKKKQKDMFAWPSTYQAIKQGNHTKSRAGNPQKEDFAEKGMIR